MLAGIAGKQIQVGLAVAIVEEKQGAIITALGDMVGITKGDDPGGSRGKERDYRMPGNVARKYGECPGFPLVCIDVALGVRY